MVSAHQPAMSRQTQSRLTLRNLFLGTFTARAKLKGRCQRSDLTDESCNSVQA